MNLAWKMSYIYLHGFASSPHSAKATYLRDRFSELGINLQIPDLNQGDFSRLTLTRQLQQVAAEFPPPPTPVTLIGSSFGGLTAMWLAQGSAQVQRLILLAPAFQFLAYWLPKLGAQQVRQWQENNAIDVYHYGEGRKLPLEYEFVRDAQQYREGALTREIPTLILHGNADEVVPVQASRHFATSRPWVNFRELDSEHGLGNAMPEIWQAIQEFCRLDGVEPLQSGESFV